MSKGEQVTELLLRWEELREQGKDISAAELCRECPELVPEVQRRIEALQSMYRVLDRGQPVTLPVDASTAPGTSGPAVPGYEVLDKLGEGGMGVVYQAVQLRPRRPVALKMIKGDAFPDELDRKRFRQEAEAIARLQHPNIVQVYEVGEHLGRPFFSLEYVEGGSLHRKLDGKPLPPKQAAELVEHLSRALHAAHQKGIIHRDLKPGNVLLAADGTPKVTAFGLAKRLDESLGPTVSGAVVGTPSYMPPEQALGRREQIGPAADVYALGAILYECLTGRPPFVGQDALSTLYQVVQDEPVPPSHLQPKLPADLETICLKCLQKEARRRYASAEELAEDLRRFRAEPIRARPVGRSEKAVKWVRRNPALAGALAAAVLILLAGTGISTYFGIDSAHQAQQARTSEADARKNEADAVSAQTELEKANVGLRQSRDELERTLARSLLRPLGLQGSQPRERAVPLTDPEIEALEELAGTQEERLKYRFIEEALRGPVTIRQLRNRADYSLHAVATLDSGKRTEVERLLVERLRDQKLNEEQRTDVALALAALGSLTPATAAQVGQTLTGAMARTTNPDELRALAQDLSAVVARLESKEAAQVCGQAAATLTQAMTKTIDPYALEALAQDLSAVAARLESKEAAEAAATLTQVTANTTNPYALHWLAQGLSAVAARLEPQEAAQLCGQAAATLTQAMAQTTDYSKVDALAQGLSAVAARLEPKEFAATLTQAMAKTTYPYALQVLAQKLSAVAARLEPKEAAQLCGQAAATLTQAMTKTTDPNTQRLLAQGLSAVAARLEPKEAGQLCGQAAATLTQVTANTTNPDALEALAQGLSAVAARLEPKEAAEAAATLTKAMTKTTNAHALHLLAQGLSAVAARLEPKEAGQLCGQAAATLTQAMPKTHDPDALGELAKGLSAVAARLEPKLAAQLCGLAAATLTQVTANLIHPRSREPLAQGLLAVAARLEPKLAAQLCGLAAAFLTHFTANTTSPYALEPLAQALSAVAARLEPQEAAQLCGQAAATLTQAMTKTTNPFELYLLAVGLSAVAARLEPKQAAEAAAILTQAMARATTNLYTLRSWAQGLSRVFTGLDVPERSLRTTAAAATSIGSLAGPGQTFASLALLGAALEPLPCRLSTQDLVDLLKQPLCVGQARRVVLDQLENRYRRKFADHWEFVHWAEANLPDLDLRSPPKRPGH